MSIFNQLIVLIDEKFAEKKIAGNDSVRLLDEIVEEMDLSPLYRAYERHGRHPATAPSTMLKIVLYSYMEGKYSAREIETACNRSEQANLGVLRFFARSFQHFDAVTSLFAFQWAQKRSCAKFPFCYSPIFFAVFQNL